MPITAQFVPPTAQLNAIGTRIARAPAIMQTLHKRGMSRLGQRAMKVLRVEPAPRDTTGITRMMTPRQRRFVHAMRGDREGAYPRTHGISQGWQYKVETLDRGGAFTLYNNAPGATYVEGFDQQPFLAALGWLYAPPILQQFMEEAERITAANWLTASDPFAGVPR